MKSLPKLALFSSYIFSAAVFCNAAAVCEPLCRPDIKTPAHRPLAAYNKQFLSYLGLDEKYMGVHGYIETRHYFDVKKNNKSENFYEFRNNLRLIKDFRFSPQIQAKFSFDGRLFYASNAKDSLRNIDDSMRPWEAFVDYSGNGFDLRVGQQLIRWGKSDELNPTDVFTPEDLKEFLNYIDRADRKIPVLAAKLNYYINNYTLEGIYLPFFKKQEYDISGGDWEPYLPKYYRSLGFTPLDDRGPLKQFKNSTYAVKIKRQGQDSDVSLSYSYHFAETPALKLIPTSPLTRDIQYDYPRQHTIGSDFETVAGKFVFRGECALTTNQPFLSYDPNIPSTVLERTGFLYIIGGDYTFKHGTYLNLQYAQQFIVNYPGELAVQQGEDSVLWRVTHNFRHNTITFRNTGRYFLSSREMMVETSMMYKLTDDFSATAGFYIYAGDVSGIYGQFKDNNQIFIRLRYTI